METINQPNRVILVYKTIPRLLSYRPTWMYIENLKYDNVIIPAKGIDNSPGV